MSFQLRFTAEAKADLERLFEFFAQTDPEVGKRALSTIQRAWGVLEEFPFSCRKADPLNPFLRELVIPFGGAGYVALFEIDDAQTVTVLALRHQREDDYH
nr:type II toxin-antitoxin system RelE/ParE family toxin [Oceanococcus sp. HetDA_MAG_MS8]